MNTYTYKLKTELYREYKVSCEQAVLKQIHDDDDYLTLQNSDGYLIVLNQDLPFRGSYKVDSDFF
ncbi:MAG: hypothetical protein Q9M50_00100 [Methylococcales bacterium]|nr:hypothetical protein [Methylococcales bacterium]